MSGITKILQARVALTKVKGKALGDALAKAMSPSEIANYNPLHGDAKSHPKGAKGAPSK